jgi:hypothetical protein
MSEPRVARKRQRQDSATSALSSITEALSHTPRRTSKPPVPQYVSKTLELLPPYCICALNTAARASSTAQARAIIRAQDPLLEQILQVRTITTRRHTDRGTALENFINVRVRENYSTMVHHERAGSTPGGAVMFCFMASTQLEPIVVVVVVHPELGRLVHITETHLTQLEVALDQFRKQFQLEGETYAYTGVHERQRGSEHSQHFHLKIRIPTEMYLEIFPAMRVLARTRNMLQPYKRLWEPLTYKFEKQPTAPWPTVRLLVQLPVHCVFFLGGVG